MIKYIIFVSFVFVLCSAVADLNRQRRLGDKVPVQDVIKNFTHNVPVEHYKNVTYMVVNGTRLCRQWEEAVFWDKFEKYCDIKVPVVRQELIYKLQVVVKSVYEKGVCPTDQVICCQGYQEYKGNCYTPKEMQGLDALSGLAGLLGRRR